MPESTLDTAVSEAINNAFDTAKGHAEGMHKKATEALVKLNGRLTALEEAPELIASEYAKSFESIAAGLEEMRGHVARLEAPVEPDLSELYKALAIAQGSIQSAMQTQTAEVKNREGRLLYTFDFADLASCLEVCRKPLSENGLAIIQLPTLGDPTEIQRGGDKFTVSTVHLQTILAHNTGVTVSTCMEMTPDKPGPQAMGSCITYLRRYMLCAMVGIAQADDDARAATRTAEDEPSITPDQAGDILALADKLFGEKSDGAIKYMLTTAFPDLTAVSQIPAENYDSVVKLLNNQAKPKAKPDPKPKPKPKPAKDKAGSAPSD